MGLVQGWGAGAELGPWGQGCSTGAELGPLWGVGLGLQGAGLGFGGGAGSPWEQGCSTVGGRRRGQSWVSPEAGLGWASRVQGAGV